MLTTYSSSMEFLAAIGLIVVLVIIIIVLAVLLARQRAAIDQEKQRERKLERIYNLRQVGRMQPHFMANNLLLVERLGLTDPDGMKRAIRAFAQYYRDNSYVLEHDELCPLQDELNRLNGYLELEGCDPHCKVVVKQVIADNAQDALIPPMIVQPLMESAIRHGVGSQTEGGCVELRAEIRGGSLCISIHDNGAPFDTSLINSTDKRAVTGSLTKRREQVFLGVRERLELTCGGRLSVESNEDGTTVIVELPLGDAESRA